jgi:hypothetical protein
MLLLVVAKSRRGVRGSRGSRGSNNNRGGGRGRGRGGRGRAAAIDRGGLINENRIVAKEIDLTTTGPNEDESDNEIQEELARISKLEKRLSTEQKLKQKRLEIERKLQELAAEDQESEVLASANRE